MRVLAAVNGSEKSLNAFRSACRIAKALGYYVTVFYVDTADDFTAEETRWPFIKARIEKEQRQLRRDVIRGAVASGRALGVEVEGVVSRGAPAVEITDYVAANGVIRLVAMGCSSGELFSASVTKAVAAVSTRPVLVVSSEFEVRRILAVVDDERTAGAVAAFAGMPAKSIGATISILACVPDAAETAAKYAMISEVPDMAARASVREMERLYARRLDALVAASTLAVGRLGITAAVETFRGDPYAAIAAGPPNDAGGQAPFDLLVVSGRSGLNEPLTPLAESLLKTHAFNVVLVQ
jgi:nucleotide-binding universal stress UspA family protein